jgi:hypothetical protein
MGKKNIERPRNRKNVKLAADLLHPSVHPRERADGRPKIPRTVWNPEDSLPFP